MKFSIIIITYNRKKELLECLETIKSQCIQYPYEVIIIFNGETSYLEKTRLNYPQFKCTSISRTTPGAARNSAIKYATGEYFFFLDDDCLLPKNYFDQVKFDQGWDILGGPDKTPPISSQLQQNIGKALASPLCMGPTYRRHHQSKDYLVNANEESLILCNLWFQASNFHEGYRFNEKIFRNEDSLTKAKAIPYKIQSSKFDPQAQVIKLKSGVSLFYRQNKMTPTFILHAYLRGGLSEESSSNNGYHHLLATNLTKGFDKISYDKMKFLLEDRSASLHGFSGKNAYGLLMHGLTDNFHELIPLFEGSLLRPAIPAKYLKHEKEIAVRALENQKEDPVKHCFTEANQLFFNKHPYAQNALGTNATIKKISQKLLLDIHKKNLKNKEILLTYCGDLELPEVLATLKPLIDGLPARPSKKVTFKKYTPITGKEKFIKFDREQTQIFYGIPCGKMGSIENTYLKMLATQLSGQSSELFVEVRDRQGLCYSAQPVHHTALEGGYFGIYMASGHDKTVAAINAIKDIIVRHQKEGLTKEEFDRIKKMIKGQNQLNIQTNEDYASVYSVAILQDEGIDYWHKGNQEIENLKYEDFQKGLKKILSQKWNTIIVGRESK